MSRCDILIIPAGDVETRRIFASSQLLRDLSKKWNELLSEAQTCDSTKDSDNKKTIYIPQIPQNIMDGVIKYINATFVDPNLQRIPVCDENLNDYFSAGKFLEMEEIQTFCLDYLKARESTLENMSFLFKLIGAFDNPDGDKIVTLKIRDFFMQNKHQLDVVVRKCKSEGVLEDVLIKLLVSWFKAKGDLDLEGVNLDLNLDFNWDNLLQEFSSTENKFKILEAFHQISDLQGKNKAFSLLMNLAQNLNVNNSRQEQNQNVDSAPTQNENENEIENHHRSVEIDINMELLGNVNVGNFEGNLNNPPKLPTPPLHFAPTARKSCKRRRTEIPETENNNNNSNNNNEHDKGKDSVMETCVKTEVIENDPSQTFSSSFPASTSAPSTMLSSASGPEPEPKLQEPEPELETDLNNLNSSTNTNVVSAPQGIVYFLLGTRQIPQGLQFCSFNIKTREFLEEGNLPATFRRLRRLAMLHHQGDIYFMGGENFVTGKLTNDVYIFNLETQTWQMTEMIERRFDFKAVVLNNYIYAVGGCVEDPKGPEFEGIGINTVEKLSLDPKTCSKWEFADCLINCRSDCGLAVLNGKIYAIGGCVAVKKGGLMSASCRCECFDPTARKSKGQWSSIAPMKHKRLGLSTVATTTRIFALGGATSFLGSAKGLKTVEIYDPETNSWKDGPSMNRPRKFFSAVVFENRIYAFGGDDDLNEPTMEQFNLETQRWTVQCFLKATQNFSTVAFR